MEAERNNTRPNVFEYNDYRKYLKDTYLHFKSHSPAFSFRYFSQRAGFRSPNFLKLVIEGKRNLSDDSIPRFSQALKMAKSETEFFTHLVHFNQAKNASQRSEAAGRMLQTKGFLKVHPLQQAEYAYYANWYYIPVREMVGFPDFQEDPNWVARRLVPAITPQQATAALRDLEALGLLIRGSDGVLKQAQRTVTTANEVSSSAIVNYHKDMLNLAALSIDTVPRDKREISAACVPVSQKTAARIKCLIQEFRDQVLALAHEDSDPETIYQLNMQLFPLSRTGERE